jgi:hypothetical protein
MSENDARCYSVHSDAIKTSVALLSKALTEMQLSSHLRYWYICSPWNATNDRGRINDPQVGSVQERHCRRATEFGCPDPRIWLARESVRIWIPLQQFRGGGGSGLEATVVLASIICSLHSIYSCIYININIHTHELFCKFEIYHRYTITITIATDYQTLTHFFLFAVWISNQNLQSIS